MVCRYANEHNQTMEFPKHVKRNDRISRDSYLGAKLTFQYLDYSELNFLSKLLTQNNFYSCQTFNFNNLEYVRTISFT